MDNEDWNVRLIAQHISTYIYALDCYATIDNPLPQIRIQINPPFSPVDYSFVHRELTGRISKPHFVQFTGGNMNDCAICMEPIL